VDTDIVIDIEKKRLPIPRAACHISIITLYEYIRGKKNSLYAKKLVEEIFIVIPLDNKILEKAIEIWKKLKYKGEPVDERDLLIGATAIVYNLPLYTRNKKHYIRLIDFGLKFYG